MSSAKELDRDSIVEFASPPCFMHELDPDYSWAPARTDAWTDVARWRKAERKRLLEQRMRLSAEERQARSERIGRALDRVAAIVNAFPEIAHNYERDHALNMWFVIATEDDRSTAAVVASIEQQSGYRVLLFPKEREYFVQLMLAA